MNNALRCAIYQITSAAGSHDCLPFYYSAGRFGVLRYGSRENTRWVARNIVWC